MGARPDSVRVSGSGCPCGSGVLYGACCRPLLRSQVEAPTAESLMRSRYTAYVRRDSEYVLRTWHATTRPEDTDPAGDDAAWRGLEVLNVVDGRAHDDAGIVSFAAHFEEPSGAIGTLRETSRFVREDGLWFYVDGNVS